MKISLIVPVYNVGRFLREALDSFCAQTYDNWEVICVDDGSTDGSEKVLDEYAARDNRFKVIHQKNCGTVIARKRAAEICTGDYVLFVDPDDLLAEDALEVVVKDLTASPVDILQYGVEIIESYTRTPAQMAQSQKYFNPVVAPLSDEQILLAAYRDGKMGWGLIFRCFRGDLVRRQFAKIPEIVSINETDAYAFFYLAVEAKSYRKIDAKLYRYRYGVGISTKKGYSLDEYIRTLGKIPCAYDLLDLGNRLQEKLPAAKECAEIAACRMISNSWGSALTRLHGVALQNQAIRELMSRTQPLEWVAAMAFKYERMPQEFMAQVERLGLLPPPVKRPIRHIGVYYYWLKPGGIQRVIAGQLRLFLQLGYKVTLFLEEAPTENCFSVPPEVSIVYLPSSLGPSKVPAWQRVLQLSALIKSTGVDVLYHHAYASEMLPWEILTCRMVAKIPLVMHRHCVFASTLFSELESTQRSFGFHARIYSWADGVIALSQADANFIRLAGGRVRYLPNLPSEEFQAELKKNIPKRVGQRILWVARMSWEKHPNDVVRILKGVREHLPNATLTMVGGGNESCLNGVIRAVATEGLQDAVRFTGSITQVIDEYRQADVFLTTSTIEGFPLTSLEALCCGLPIVAYAIPHLEVYRDNPAVVQVASGNISAAADALVEILDSSNRQKLRETAKDSVRKFVDYPFAKVWQEILAELSTGTFGASELVGPTAGSGMLGVLIRGINNLVGFSWRCITLREREKLQLAKSEEQLKNHNQRQAQDIAKLTREVAALKVSQAYRVGMFVTWPARKVWGGVKCLRENGVKYTGKHVVGKVLRGIGLKRVKW